MSPEPQSLEKQHFFVTHAPNEDCCKHVLDDLAVQVLLQVLDDDNKHTLFR